jgi:hypothetical protein
MKPRVFSSSRLFPAKKNPFLTGFCDPLADDPKTVRLKQLPNQAGRVAVREKKPHHRAGTKDKRLVVDD